MSRPLMTAVAAQQSVIDALRAGRAADKQLLEIQGRQIARIAQLAGITDEIEALAPRTADIANPAQPIPDPAPQGPSETTEQAATPMTNDDPRAPGQTGGSTEHVPASAADTALTPGGTIPTPPYNQLQDVTAPVSGHLDIAHTPPESLRIETDVRVGEPMQPEVAFPWTISPNQSNSAPPKDGEMSQTGGGSPSRTHACLRLARLRVQAGLAQGDDIVLAGRLEADSSLTDDKINHEIGILDRLATAARPAPANGRVAARGPERVAPSLASQGSTTAAPTAGDDGLSDLFS